MKRQESQFFLVIYTKRQETLTDFLMNTFVIVQSKKLQTV